MVTALSAAFKPRQQETDSGSECCNLFLGSWELLSHACLALGALLPLRWVPRFCLAEEEGDIRKSGLKLPYQT